MDLGLVPLPRFLKKSKRSQNRGMRLNQCCYIYLSRADLVPSQAPPRGLPPELLLLILSYVEEYRDLYSLCLTCRALQAVAETVLYRSISTVRSSLSGKYAGVVALDQTMHEKLYKTIRSRGFAHMVTNFTIIFELCGVPQPKPIWWRCTCDKFDAMLGQVLLSLQNLQVLHFSCSGCCTRGAYHGYLTQLPTQKLQEFAFDCHCRQQPIKTHQILTSPCMAPVMSLVFLNPYKWEDYDVLSTKGCLPRLKKFMCSDINLVEALLPTRTITHLSCSSRISDLGRLHDIISRTRCSLTYLQVHDFSHIIPYFIRMDSTPYRSLKHLGELDFINVPVRYFQNHFE
jgi:hypothetical protein